MNFIKTLKSSATVLAVGAGILLTACSGGGTVQQQSGGNPNSGDLSKLSMVVPSAFPVTNFAATMQLIIINNGTTAVNNLQYSIADNTTGANITVTDASAKTCRVIAAGATCTIQATIPANSNTGSFRLRASQYSSLTAKQVKINNLATSISTPTVGLVLAPTNSNSGAAGVNFYYPGTIISNADSSTQIIVVAYVNSANAGSFNTINLVDSNRNLLSNYEVLSGNSGNNLTNLTQGSIVTFLVTIPSGSTQFQFNGQTAHNGSVVSTSDSSNTTSVVPAGTTIGILNVLPNFFSLTESHESQVVTLNNSGNATVSDLNITSESPLTLVSNTCGTTLAANAYCTYTVKFNSSSSSSGTTGIIFRYNNGSETLEPTATVNYKGSGSSPVVDVGLEITDSSGNFDFTSRTKTPTQTDLVTLTNTGGVAVRDFNYSSLPKYFTVTTAGLATPCTDSTVLTSGQSCNISLTYTNDTVTASTTVAKEIGYSYTLDGMTKTGSSTIDITYQTVQSAAILNVTPISVDFGDVLNNNSVIATKTITVSNNGDDEATSLGAVLSDGGDADLFSLAGGDTTCGSSLAAGKSCEYVINFGPIPASTVIGNKMATLNIGYAAYSGGTSSNPQIELIGNVVTPQSAVISRSSAVATGFMGGPGDADYSAYQVAQNSDSPTLSYVITNSGKGPASGFYLTGSPSDSVWNMSTDCGTSSLPVTLAANGGKCNVTFTLNTTNIGLASLALSTIQMNWSDEISPEEISQSLGDSIVYANVYAPASVAINPLSAMVTEGSATSTPFSATLTGGYAVDVQTVTIVPDTTATNAGIGGGACTVSSANSTCTIDVSTTANTPAGIYTLNVTKPFSSSGMQIQLTVNSSSKMIFVTSGSWNGDLKTAGNGSTGFDGADKLCQAAGAAGSKTQGLGATWKAILYNNNATKQGIQYHNSLGTVLGTATGGNFVGKLGSPVADILTEDGYTAAPTPTAWTGGDNYDRQDCTEWTQTSLSEAGVDVPIYGTIGYPWTYTSGDLWWDASLEQCTRPQRLYCAQQ